MSTNQVPDIGEMLRFYELKEEIQSALIYNIADTYGWNGELENTFMALINKIESLGKNFNKEK